MDLTTWASFTGSDATAVMFGFKTKMLTTLGVTALVGTVARLALS
jgi:hypothetical protein